jgi:short chain dehydrogenase
MNPVMALGMKWNTVGSTCRTTHHRGDAVVKAPAGDPGDCCIAQRAASALFIPERAKSAGTPKRFQHVSPLSFFEVGFEASPSAKSVSARTCVQFAPIQSSVMPRLQGKRALITGGTSGIGLETARRFLEEGVRVAITGFSKTGLDAARNELGDVIVIEADAGDMADQGEVADEIRKAFGQLDILFINAGIVELKPLGQWEGWHLTDRSTRT